LGVEPRWAVFIAVIALLFTGLAYWQSQKAIAYYAEAALLLGMTTFLIARQSWLNSTQRLNHWTHLPSYLSVYITSPPQIRGGRCTFTARAITAHARKLQLACNLDILVRARSPIQIHCGEKVLLGGTIIPVETFKKQKGFFCYLFANNISYVINAASLKPDNTPNRSSSLGAKIQQTAQSIRRILTRYTQPLTSGILQAMLLGLKDAVPRSVYQGMMKTGTVHILVVSGYNVGLVAICIECLFKTLRIPKKLRLAITAICLLLYCLISGGSTPVVRATIMALVCMAAYLFKRSANPYTAVAASVLCILTANPRQLLDIGFQLSFASVLAIIWLYPFIQPRLKHLFLPIRYLLEGFLVSLAAWVATAGIIAYHFKSISPITILANIAIVPLASLITLSGFALAITGWALPALAPYIGKSIDVLVILLMRSNELFLQVPGGYLTWN
jgi:ComEC/Rec2-related protein